MFSHVAFSYQLVAGRTSNQNTKFLKMSDPEKAMIMPHEKPAIIGPYRVMDVELFTAMVPHSLKMMKVLPTFA